MEFLLSICDRYLLIVFFVFLFILEFEKSELGVLWKGGKFMK